MSHSILESPTCHSQLSTSLVTYADRTVDLTIPSHSGAIAYCSAFHWLRYDERRNADLLRPPPTQIDRWRCIRDQVCVDSSYNLQICRTNESLVGGLRCSHKNPFRSWSVTYPQLRAVVQVVILSQRCSERAWTCVDLDSSSRWNPSHKIYNIICRWVSHPVVHRYHYLLHARSDCVLPPCWKRTARQ
jgi:hypothetical protein